ncbi:TonB-dependent receptor domain-containing protein [Brevundimonas sp. P7753]|uniref:TonB-dependent receptor domain-containing protein n=1 Tax=Brevundimonas sp. P7753 TaxID=2726982 RepID=UPI0015C11991|nr:TonB-dependent receptor [Brevundimonas sp. P7753]NWE53964.1 TonB-dependent receptor [Brevundimonas sp. P7753]
MTTFHSTLAGLLLATTALATSAFAQEAPVATDAPVAASDQDQPSAIGDIVVLGRFIPEQNRRSPEVAAFLTAEDLQRTGDGTAAEALTRVTGLSIVEGRFVYVRGLGERYSSALLNGSPLPSPEPLQRVVPLDLFPSEILAGVTVQKTYSVAYPGEFGGGVIDLTTISAPSKPFFNFKSSLGVNSETTAREGLVYFGSRTDFTGFDDGTRDVPGPLRLAFQSGRRVVAGADFSNDDLRRIGQSLENAPLRLLQKEETPVNFGFQASGGLSEQLGFGTLGLVFVAGYDNKWQSREGVRQEGYIDEGELKVGTDYQFQSTQNDIGLNLLGGVSLEAGDHEVRWTNFYTRNTTKEARTRAGFNYLSGNVVRDDYTEWSVRQLFSTQLAGEHFFGEAWEAKWRLAYAKTTRDAPYETRFGYGQLPDGTFVHNIQSNRISFSELDDDLLSGGLDLSYRLNLSGGREAVFSVGAASSDNTRTSQQRDLRFVAPNGLSADQVKSRVDYLFSDYNIGPYLQIEEVTGSNGAAAYEADLRVHAAYAQLQAELIPTVNFTAGVRYEDGRQSVTPRDLFGGTTGFLPSTIEEAYALPAATVTWNFAEDMQLRAGASKTIGRPQFRELAPQQYTDVESDRTFIGNPYLLDTEITNYDLRYEWYFARQQYLTLGVFYKLLEKPIESSVVDQGASISQTFLNAPEAVVQGAEIELKKYFEFPSAGLDFVANKRWLMSGNYTYSNSEVRVGEGDMVITQNSLGVAQPASFYVVDGSRLQGQSDHVANLQLGWEDDTARSQATLILNYVSERTSARGRPGEPDLVQDPGVFLDFVYRKDFEVMGRELGLGIELRNLLRTDYDEYQELGQKVRVNNYDLGASASVSLTARF